MDEKIIQPQITDKKMDFHKVFAAVGIILIVMIIIGGGMWYMVQSAEDKIPVDDDITVTKVATNSAKTASSSAIPSDWKTYETKEYTFKYPKDWKAEVKKIQRPEGEQEEIRLLSPNAKVSEIGVEAGEGMVSVTQGTLIRFLISNQYTSEKKLIDYVKEVNPEVTSGGGAVSEAPVGKERAVRVDTKVGLYGGAETDFISTVYYVVNDGKLYEIARLYESGKQSEFEDIFKKIIATFKFL